MEKIELKPCPFCGAELYKTSTEDFCGYSHSIFVHPDNYCCIRGMYLYEGSIDVTLWNRRADDE